MDLSSVSDPPDLTDVSSPLGQSFLAMLALLPDTIMSKIDVNIPVKGRCTSITIVAEDHANLEA